MAKEIIEFTIPQAFADEGEYEVLLNDMTAKITVELIQNDASLGNVGGMNVSTTGSGRVSFSSDSFGIANVTKIIIEFPKIISSKLDEKEINPIVLSLVVKQECIRYVNRLIEVIRIHTKKYWLRYISEQDVLGYSSTQIDDNEKSFKTMIMDFGSGLSFPIQVLEQKGVHDKIIQSLKTNQKISYDSNLYLDAIGYYFTRRFNTAVAMMYVGLEVGISNYIIIKLKQKKIPKEEIDKIMRKVLRSGISKILDFHLKENTGKSLKENDKLWKKFEKIRDVRKSVIHPYPKILSQQEAYETLAEIQEILGWFYQDIKID